MIVSLTNLKTCVQIENEESYTSKLASFTYVLNYIQLVCENDRNSFSNLVLLSIYKTSIA